MPRSCISPQFFHSASWGSGRGELFPLPFFSFKGNNGNFSRSCLFLLKEQEEWLLLGSPPSTQSSIQPLPLKGEVWGSPSVGPPGFPLVSPIQLGSYSTLNPPLRLSLNGQSDSLEDGLLGERGRFLTQGRKKGKRFTSNGLSPWPPMGSRLQLFCSGWC